MSSSIPTSMLEKFTNFGDLLRFLRRRAGITQLELSIAVGYSDAQISRLEQNLRLPDIPTIEARFIPALALQDEPNAVGRLLELAANVRREDAPGLGLCPFKGLSYFDEADADLFVGREALTSRLAARVLALVEDKPASERFLAVVGASGSGKSSLVRAGLVPALRWNPVSAGWPIHVFSPGPHPLEKLALTLTAPDVSVGAAAALIDDMARDARSLHLAVSRSLKPGGRSRMLLVIDQFEEVFTLCRSDEERSAFIGNLMQAASELDGPTVIVITLRADFYAHCAAYPLLREALSRCQEYIGVMTDEELCRAIEEPARRGRWELEPGLVDLLLSDVGREPGALPLLSHALLETWQRRRARTLTLSGYTSSGGVRGAIAETAEAVFADQFSSEQQDIARRIFLRLTELGDETATGDTRRRAGLDELVLNPEQADQTRRMIQVLADARLITTSEDAVEVAHEALIREWPRLRGWLEDNREGLRLQRHLTQASLEWDQRGHEPDLLYRGARLSQAGEWALTRDQELLALERRFLAASLEAREQEAVEREARRQRELEAAQRLAEAESRRASDQARSAGQLRKRAVYLTAAFLVALLTSLTALYFGPQARQTAVTASNDRRIAQARELAAASLNNISVDPERSILLALRAVSTTRSVDGSVLPEAQEALHRSIVSSPIRMTLRSLGTRAFSAAFSPDGKRLAVIGDNGTVVVWDPATGKELLRLPGSTTPGELVSGNRVVYSPDGRLLAACDNNAVKLYDAASGTLVRELSGDQSEVLAVAISRDGRRIASGSLDGKVRIWDTASGSMLHLLEAHTDWIESLDFSPDGKWLASGSNDYTLKVWDVLTGDLLRNYAGSTAVIDSISFSPDGTRLAFTDGYIHVWRLDQGSLPLPDSIADHELLNLAGGIYVKFSPDGKFLAAAGGPEEAKLRDAATGRELISLVGHTDWVMGLAFSPDGATLASTSLDGTVRLWSLLPGNERLTVKGQGGAYGTRIAFNPMAPEFAVNEDDGTATIWDAATGRPKLTLSGHTDGVMAVAFSPDGRRIATGSLDATVIVRDSASGRRLLTLSGHELGVRDIAFSPDGRLIATGGFDKTARIWESQTGKELLKITGHEGLVVGVAFSKDGTRLATSSTDGSAKVWDVKTGQLFFALAGHTAAIVDITYSPDGSRIATASADGTAKVWDARSGSELLTLAGHSSGVTVVAFSPDGKLLGTGSNDNTAKVWDAATGRELLTLPGGPLGVSGVAFSPLDGGAEMAVASYDGTVRLFLLHLDDLLALAKSRITRSLTDQECRKYLHLDACPALEGPGSG